MFVLYISVYHKSDWIKGNNIKHFKDCISSLILIVRVNVKLQFSEFILRHITMVHIAVYCVHVLLLNKFKNPIILPER